MVDVAARRPSDGGDLGHCLLDRNTVERLAEQGVEIDRSHLSLASYRSEDVLVLLTFPTVALLMGNLTGRVREEAKQTPADLQWMVNPREEVDATLSDAADVVREAGLEVETFAREGDPADAILDVAEERGADLIVVGNKGMTGARRFLLGSVPNRVSHHAPCSVLIVRTT